MSLGYYKKMSCVSKRTALEQIENVFVKYGVLEVELNGSLTVPDVEGYLNMQGYDFEMDKTDLPVIRLTSNVDLPRIYAETV